MGLAMVEYLLSLPNWKVLLADIRTEVYDAIKPTLDADRHLFVNTDVGSWNDQAALFRAAFRWSDGKIDFFAANAGAIAHDHITRGSWNLDDEPKKPSTKCTQICQIAVFYGMRLFVHYSRKTTKKLKELGNGTTQYNPKMVITASCSALYPFYLDAEYAMAKAACVHLTRSVGQSLLESDNIAINCIMPGFVPTPLAAQEIKELWPPQYLTPLSTIIRAVVELISETGFVDQDGKSNGESGKIKAGQAVEVAVDRLYYRQPPEYADASQKFLIEESYTPEGVWAQGIKKMVENGKIPRQ